MIEVKHVKKYYTMGGGNVVKALDDVSFTVNDGEFVAIIGPSGSGKSTLMNVLGCLDVPTEGEYFIDGVLVKNFKENDLAKFRNKKIGFIFQGFNLLAKLTARENVELPLIYQGLKREERKQRVEQALEVVGMSERGAHKPSELSGGQQQRVAIARAFATHPSIILADEPTGNLDSKTGADVMEILTQLNSNGVTIVLITHDEKVAQYAHRVYRMIDGKLTEISKQELSHWREAETQAQTKGNAQQSVQQQPTQPKQKRKISRRKSVLEGEKE